MSNKYNQLELIEFTLVNNIPYDDDISWWNINRRKLNNLIDSYNMLVLNPSKLDVCELLFKIDWLLAKYTGVDDDSFTDWQIELCNELKRLIKEQFGSYL